MPRRFSNFLPSANVAIPLCRANINIFLDITYSSNNILIPLRKFVNIDANERNHHYDFHINTDYLSQFLYKEFCNNGVIQKLLLWEMSADNETTRRTARIRDLMNMNLLEYYDILFKPTHINIRSVVALLISGIYYLILHKERAPFCKIDFDTPEGEAAFSEAVDTLVELLFDRIEAHNEKRACMNACSKTESARKRPVNTWGGVSMNSTAENCDLQRIC